jgi:hypothetical protein
MLRCAPLVPTQVCDECGGKSRQLHHSAHGAWRREGGSNSYGIAPRRFSKPRPAPSVGWSLLILLRPAAKIRQRGAETCPRRESNPDLRFRRPAPCPLGHVGVVSLDGIEPPCLLDISEVPSPTWPQRHARDERRVRDSNPRRYHPLRASNAAPSARLGQPFDRRTARPVPDSNRRSPA